LCLETFQSIVVFQGILGMLLHLHITMSSVGKDVKKKKDVCNTTLAIHAYALLFLFNMLTIAWNMQS